MKLYIYHHLLVLGLLGTSHTPSFHPAFTTPPTPHPTQRHCTAVSEHVSEALWGSPQLSLPVVSLLKQNDASRSQHQELHLLGVIDHLRLLVNPASDGLTENILVPAGTRTRHHQALIILQDLSINMQKARVEANKTQLKSYQTML